MDKITGYCIPLKNLASEAGRVYDKPWDAIKHVGCVCDSGYRGPDCSQQECPSQKDPLGFSLLPACIVCVNFTQFYYLFQAVLVQRLAAIAQVEEYVTIQLVCVIAF